MPRDLSTSFFIAYKSITRGRKSTLLLIVFILSLSFVNMLFISGVLAGIWDSELDAYINFAAAHISINPQQQPTVKQYIENQDSVRAAILTIPGVIQTVRHYQLAGSFSYDKDKNGQYVSISGILLGIDPGEDEKVFIVQNRMLAGERLQSSDTDQVVLSSAVAGGYNAIQRAGADLGGAKVGDKVRITYANGVQRTYTIKGIYDDALGINYSFITAKEAESVLGVSNSANKILLRTDLSRDPIDYYQRRIQSMFPNLVVKTYMSDLGSIASFQAALNLISIIVSAISVMVAAITIFVLIYVNAISKQRQIGILKAIGIKQSIIVNAYVMQSLFYTCCGVAAGFFAVFAFLRPLLLWRPVPLISGVMNLTLSYNTLGVAIGIACFIIAGFLAGRIPAKLVARKDILTAIWG